MIVLVGCHSSVPQLEEVFGKQVQVYFSARVTRIIDGDTVEVLNPDKALLKIRLDSIDAPEKKQPFSAVATEELGKMIHEREVEVLQTGVDRYKRRLAFVRCGGEIVNAEMIKRGLAWQYREYSDDMYLAMLQETAKTERVGLWSEPEPIPPWEFRKRRN